MSTELMAASQMIYICIVDTKIEKLPTVSEHWVWDPDAFLAKTRDRHPGCTVTLISKTQAEELRRINKGFGDLDAILAKAGIKL